jgi:hypothetical protein
MKQSRQELLEEERLRKVIREGYKAILARREQGKKQSFLQERKLRKIIRHLIRETAISDNDPSPHPSTGINVLEDLLKKIIPVLETDFKKLTSDDSQRASFKNHILQAVKDTLAPSRSLDKADDEDASKMISIDEQEDEEENIPQDDMEQDKFIDIDDKPAEDPADPREKFGIQGQDETGRNVAFESFKKIGSNIVDAYDVLSSDEDKETFYDYLLSNLSLYFKKFENDMGLTGDVDVPDTGAPDSEKVGDDDDKPDNVVDPQAI